MCVGGWLGGWPGRWVWVSRTQSGGLARYAPSARGSSLQCVAIARGSTPASRQHHSTGPDIRAANSPVL